MDSFIAEFFRQSNLSGFLSLCRACNSVVAPFAYYFGGHMSQVLWVGSSVRPCMLIIYLCQGG